MFRVQLHTDNPALDGLLVARIMPDPEVAHWETAVQDHLARHGFITPTVRLSSPPGLHLDRAWMLMDHALGKPYLSDLCKSANMADVPHLARLIPDALARDTAALHAIDPERLIAKLGTRDLLSELRKKTVEVGQDELVSVADKLVQDHPQGGPIVVCHGDLHPFNVLSHPTGDTILDWSTARLASPEYDLAFTRLLFQYYPLPVPPHMASVMERLGRPVARRFLRTYDRIGPRPIDRDRLSWFTRMQALRIVTEVCARYASGESVEDTHPFRILASRVQASLGLDLPVLA